MHTIIKRSAAAILARLQLARNISTGLNILCYHRIVASWESYPPGLPALVFLQQIACLEKYFSVISLDDAVRTLADNALPRRSVVLTFDDGTEDFHTTAWPILCAKGLPATLFVITGAIDNNIEPWSFKLRRILPCCRKAKWASGHPLVGEIDFTESGVGGTQFNTKLKELPHNEAVQMLAKFEAEHLQLDVPEPESLLNWETLKKMRGLTLGAHTMTHPVLSRVSEVTAMNEIVQSKARIEEAVGTPCRHFCYPFGTTDSLTDRVRKAVREAGFSSACTTVDGSNFPGENLFSLKRRYTTERSLSLFAWHLLH